VTARPRIGWIAGAAIGSALTLCLAVRCAGRSFPDPFESLAARTAAAWSAYASSPR